MIILLLTEPQEDLAFVELLNMLPTATCSHLLLMLNALMPSGMLHS